MASIKTFLAYLATATTCFFASALPLGHDDVTLSVLSHDTFISEATCSWGDDTTLCLQSIIKNLTQTFLATYQDLPLPLPPTVEEKRGVGILPHNSLTNVVRRVQAFDHASLLSSRDARSGAGGFVGTFYWLPLSSSAYADFDKSPARVEVIANVVSKYVVEFNATELCVDFGAGISGVEGDIIANGVLTFGWGLEEFYYADPGLLERRLNGSCGVGNMKMYGTHYREVVLDK